jgi:hypothetical protein
MFGYVPYFATNGTDTFFNTKNDPAAKPSHATVPSKMGWVPKKSELRPPFQLCVSFFQNNVRPTYFFMCEGYIFTIYVMKNYNTLFDLKHLLSQKILLFEVW